MQIWRLVNPNSVGSVGGLETQGRYSVAVAVQRPEESLLAWGNLFFCISQAFHWLDKAHPHYGDQFALLEIYWF